ncbi:MAG: hypothetical protein GTN74_09750 [Proteobacteria bacterium]|nr:hypothetical protein [Pseudomonadota bacterium]NIS70302.1 hypothetical protein [Pseudomonadota bacterium]
MNPTLRAGDRLEVNPYEGRKIRPGDVIVFLSPENGSKISHRVVSTGPDGVRTRGDKNSQIDPWVIRTDQILGQVICAERGNIRRWIFGGWMGIMSATAVRTLRRVDSSMSSLLYPAYDWLSRSGIFGRLLPGQRKTRVVSFNRPAGRELQLHMGEWVIGKWMPHRRQWQIRRPFRLFVDEASLPDNLPDS